MGDLLSAFGLVFLAELGDKSMLAAVALGGTQAPLPTWIGAAVGMTAASGIAIAIAAMLGAKLPERVMRLLAAAAFLIFGVLMLISGFRG